MPRRQSVPSQLRLRGRRDRPEVRRLDRDLDEVAQVDDERRLQRRYEPHRLLGARALPPPRLELLPLRARVGHVVRVGDDHELELGGWEQ